MSPDSTRQDNLFTEQLNYVSAGLTSLKYYTKFVHILKPINEFLEVRSHQPCRMSFVELVWRKVEKMA